MNSSPRSRSALQDGGRREPAFAQSVGHRHERDDAFGEMRDRAVGLAVPDRRTVRPPRRVHQDRVLVAEREPLVGSRRGVALDARADGFAVAALGNELAHRRHAIDARRECAVAGDAGVAEFQLELGRERERDVEPVRRQKPRRAVRPFDQHDGVFRQVVEAEFGQLGGARQAVEVGMHHRKLRQIVGLHQREGRARHLDGLVAREIADQRAREHGLAGAEVARERDEVAGLQRIGDVDHEAPGGVLVRQRHREARRARRGQHHRHGAVLLERLSSSPSSRRTDAAPRTLPLAGGGRAGPHVR